MTMTVKARRRRLIVRAIELAIKGAAYLIKAAALIAGLIAFCALASLLLRACGVG